VVTKSIFNSGKFPEVEGGSTSVWSCQTQPFRVKIPLSLHSPSVGNSTCLKLIESDSLPTHFPPSSAAMVPVLPYDVWCHVASFIPKATLVKLYGVNSAFFHLALIEMYREVSIYHAGDERTQRCLLTMRCVGSRIESHEEFFISSFTQCYSGPPC